MAHSRSTTKIYLLTNIAAASIVISVLAISRWFAFDPGVMVTISEVISSLVVILFLFRRRDLKQDTISLLLTTCYLLLLVGDLAYGYFYYWLKIEIPTLSSTLLSEGPLALSYLSLVVVYLFSIRQSWNEVVLHPFFLVTILIAFPLMFRFVFPLGGISSASFTLVFLLESCSLAFTFAGIVLGMTVFVFSRGIFWSVFSLGMTTAYISGLGIRLDRLGGLPVSFSVFEALWNFGGLIAAMAIVFLSSGHDEVSKTKRRSIVVSTKMVGLITALVGTVLLSVAHWRDLQALRSIIFISIASISLAGVLGHYLWDRLVECSAALVSMLDTEFAVSRESQIQLQHIPVEMSELYEQSVKIRMRSEVARQIEENARQVAHDIRSPIAALQVALTDLRAISGQYRNIVEMSVNRLSEIASLLSFGGAGKLVESDGYTVQPVFPLIKEIVAEKSLSVDENRLLCTVSDDGIGIPLDIIPRLGTRGATFGKTSGQGLGLYHAKHTIESWGGRVEIQSNPSEGTRVSLSLPRMPYDQVGNEAVNVW